MKSILVKILLKIYSPLLQKIKEEFNTQLQHMRQETEELKKEIQNVESGMDRMNKIYNIVKSNHDDLPYLTRKVFKMRSKTSYEKAFTGNPLVSVRIATYNRANDLVNKSIASVLKQSYQNFEIVIVGDHCTDDTEEKLKALKDKRIRFYNLPSRTVYPEDRINKWRVIGAIPMNQAADMAKGSWIAPIDDDDEFTPDHLEKLIAHAKKTRCELVYGASTQKNIVTKEEKRIWSFPPEENKFTFHSAIYMKELDDIFKYDFKAWTIDEVGDWNMCRRMMESGVRISAIDDTVGVIHMIPAGHHKKEY